MSEAASGAQARRKGAAEPRLWLAVAGLEHGLRARAFGLLPEEASAEWQRQLDQVRTGLAPQDPLEEMLAAAVAAALWQAVRADRIECEVLADIAPRATRHHGSDLQERHHAAALTTALRYQAAAGAAVLRAQRAFLAHRKARLDGLLPDQPVPAPAGLHEASAAFEPQAAEPTVAPEVGCPVVGSGLGLDEASWLATLPVVEEDPKREARRRELLPEVEPPELRRAVGHAPLSAIENLLLPDMAAYEEWFARQPKPERVPAKSLTAADAALVEHVTRHNPPWLKGEYLSYWRPPVPKELLGQPGTMPECTPAPAAPASITTPLAALRARLARLLDRGAPRRQDELALAESVCAVRWPHWGPYRGTIDLDLLRRALDGRAIDGKTLTWLDSHAFAEQCRNGEG